MGVYKEITRKFFIPSLFIFLSTCTTIILSYASALNGYGEGVGIGLGVLTLLSFIPVYRNSIKIEQAVGARFQESNAARVICLVAITACVSAFMVARISALGRLSKPLTRSSYLARVEGAVDRRYDQEAALLFRIAGGRPSVPHEGEVWHRGIAYVSGVQGLHAGDEVMFAGKPVVVDNTGSASPFHRSLFCRGMRYLFYLKSEDISVVTSGTSMRIRARDRLSADCDILFNKETSSVVKALYFGNQHYIDKRVQNDFKRAGVLHVLSASGLHVGVVAAIPLFVLGLVRLNRKCILAVATLVVALYLYVTDMPVSLLRAGIMFMIYALHRMFNREVNIINTLFLSALAILVLFPYEIFSLGFQLSFGATLGILLFFRLYRSSFAYLPGRISDSLALTLAAQVPVIPVLFARVGEINVTCIVSNLIIVPAMSLLLVVSIAVSALSFLTPLAAYFGMCADALFAANKLAIGYVSGLEGHFNVSGLHPVLVAAFCLILLPLFPGNKHKKIMALSIVIGFIIAWLFLGALPSPEGNTRVITHDRGSTLLVKHGTGLAVIGSLPERSRIGLVTREIDKMPFRDISLYIPDPDYRNISGYSYLAKRFPVRRCYLSDKFPIRNFTRNFFRILDRDGVELALYDFHKPARGPGTRPQAGPREPGPERVCALYRALARPHRGEIE